MMNTASKPISDSLTLERGADGRLWANLNGESRAVAVKRCFPWTLPGRFISLTDDRRREFVLIEDLYALDPPSRALLEHELAAAGFVLEIRAIDTIAEEIEIRTWTVRTRDGVRQFQTYRDEWPRKTQRGLILVRDVAGDIYCIRSIGRLDAASRSRLSPYID